MAEILSKRDRQPRATFLSSLAAVMVAAISLTMVFGSLSTGALPFEEQEQQANVTSVSDGDTLPPEIVTRVHTETKTETVTVYNDTPQLSEALVLPELVGTKTTVTNKSLVTDKTLAEGKSLFDKKQQRYQWQYGDEVFTFFVKDNTVYRHSEKTGKTVVVFKGEKEVSLFCLNDRYLFFGEETIFTVKYDYYEISENICYCYRVDLLTGEILRLFLYYPKEEVNGGMTFIRFDGSDVVFSQEIETDYFRRYVVHEDGSYESFNDEVEPKYYPEIEVDNDYMWYNDFLLHLYEYNTFFGVDVDKNVIILHLEFSINDIEHFGYEFNDSADAKGYSCEHYYRDQYTQYIFINFEARQSDTDKSLLMYYGIWTDSGLDGGFIHVTIPDSSEMILKNQLFHDSLSISYGYNDDPLELSKLSIPVDFDKLTDDTMSEPEYYTLENGETLTLTYYPINSLHAATPDSAD